MLVKIDIFVLTKGQITTYALIYINVYRQGVT